MPAWKEENIRNVNTFLNCKLEMHCCALNLAIISLAKNKIRTHVSQIILEIYLSFLTFAILQFTKCLFPKYLVACYEGIIYRHLAILHI